MSKRTRKYVVMKLTSDFKMVDLTFERCMCWKKVNLTREGLIWYINRLNNAFKDIDVSLQDRIAKDTHGFRVDDSSFGTYYIHSTDEFFFGIEKSDKSIEPISINGFMKEIEERQRKEKARKERRIKERNYYEKHKSEFRVDPVPGTHGYKGRGYWRTPKLHRTNVNESSLEIKELYKPKNVKDVWCRTRYIDNNWKTSYKVSKQWEKHIRKRCDVGYEFENEFMNIDDIDVDMELEEDFERNFDAA